MGVSVEARTHARDGLILALGAAVLFGLVNVAAKATALHPVAKGALAYLVAGLALAPALRGARFPRHDWPLLAGMSLVGGALAPVLLFVGLQETAASTASLLLTLEMAFTALLAFVFLGERARGRPLVGLLLLLGAAVFAVLASAAAAAEGPEAAERTALRGVLLVVLAAFGWGVDNTLSARLVGRHAPHQLVALKGLVGGGAALAAAVVLGWRGEGTTGDLAAVLFIGLLGIAASVVLFYRALQRVGATRASAIFLPATALTGATGGWLLLGEPMHVLHAPAVALLMGGVALLARVPLPSDAGMPPLPPRR